MTKDFKRIILTTFVILFAFTAYSQNTKKATEAYGEGMSFYYKQDYTNAAKSFLISIPFNWKEWY